MTDAASFAIRAEALPPALRELARVLGHADAIRLVVAHGGARISVPTKARSDHHLASLLGAEAFGKLVAEYAGETLSLPKGDAYFREVRHDHVRQCREQGMTTDEIAERTGYSRRHVINILGGHADGADTFTMDLFGDGGELPDNEPAKAAEPVKIRSGQAHNPFGLTGREA